MLLPKYGHSQPHGASMPKTPENLARTRLLCRHKSVKVVLVDYDEPITY
ncbi:MAG: hypothetical protein J5606_00720 [Bacteroidales bacterium]|nr:hypothetical protein [Bacteroidales bacterium]